MDENKDRLIPSQFHCRGKYYSMYTLLYIQRVNIDSDLLLQQSITSQLNVMEQINMKIRTELGQQQQTFKVNLVRNTSYEGKTIFILSY